MNAPATLSHAEIAARIPHQGDMCLLDRVIAWTAGRIACRAVSHRDPANPLRAAGRLGAATGVEYAAQAMAIHAALLAANHSRPAAGYLTSTRGVVLHVDRLDQASEDLEIVAERLSGDERSVLYAFTVDAGSRRLLEGRITAVLDAGKSGGG